MPIHRASRAWPGELPSLSVRLDGPALPPPINYALTKQADGSHALVWNRDARKDDEQAAA